MLLKNNIIKCTYYVAIRKFGSIKEFFNCDAMLLCVNI